jgi:hypothetical protein
VDERFHRLIDPGPWGRCHLAIVDAIVARRHGIHHLLDDLERLIDLLDPDAISVVDVADLADRDRKPSRCRP